MDLKPQPIPRTAFAASLLVAMVAIGSAFLFPERGTGLDVLIWITALIPAFLLAYFRGLGRAAVTLAASMATIAALQAVIAFLSAGETSDSLPPATPAPYLGVLVGMLVLVEFLHRERRAADATALVDPISGLPNRRYVDMAIQQEFAAAERGRRLAVVLFDIDRLGAINKRFGRPSGDAVIREVAKVLEANTRMENMSARFDGGQFISVLREADAAAAVVFAQRVLDQVRGLAFPWGRQSASAGVAEFEHGMGSHELLVGAADRALFRAKEGGRDMVVTAPGKEARAAIAQRAADAAAGHGAAPAAPNSRLVYVVDDDAAVRSGVKGTLVARGFRVWDTGDPSVAVARYVAAGPDDRPALIITDVIMPVMTGMRMIAQIAESDPAVRVVFMSGYAHGEITWTGMPEGKATALVKPFEEHHLLAAVNAVLGAGTPEPPPA